MARLNTRRAKVLAKLISPDNRNVWALRSDGSVLYWTPWGWKIYSRIKQGVTPEAAIETLKKKGWLETTPPTYKTLKKWVDKGIAKTPCGCQVEPDGTCPHGRPSWIIISGII